MTLYRKYKIAKLKTFTEAKRPIEVELMLDKTAIDFLLGLSIHRRPDMASAVESIRRKIEKDGWKPGAPMQVSTKPELIDGRLRLLALQQAGYPPNAGVRMIFGIEMRPEPALV